MADLQLLCWNEVRDYARWKAVFDTDGARARAAGLIPVAVWRDVDAPRIVHFLFDVQDRARAEAFMVDPASVRSGEAAGVVGGAVAFVEPQGAP